MAPTIGDIQFLEEKERITRFPRILGLVLLLRLDLSLGLVLDRDAVRTSRFGIHITSWLNVSDAMNADDVAAGDGS